MTGLRARGDRLSDCRVSPAGVHRSRQVVDTSKYHVFLTGYDGRSDLSVCDRSPDGFCVRGSEGVEGTFSWRVVATRKDIAGARLERVEVPKEPTLPDVPASVYAPPPSPPDFSRMAVPPRRPNRKP